MTSDIFDVSFHCIVVFSSALFWIPENNVPSKNQLILCINWLDEYPMLLPWVVSEPGSTAGQHCRRVTLTVTSVLYVVKQSNESIYAPLYNP
jgi:hypothetical protein